MTNRTLKPTTYTEQEKRTLALRQAQAEFMRTLKPWQRKAVAHGSEPKQKRGKPISSRQASKAFKNVW